MTFRLKVRNQIFTIPTKNQVKLITRGKLDSSVYFSNVPLKVFTSRQTETDLLQIVRSLFCNSFMYLHRQHITREIFSQISYENLKRFSFSGSLFLKIEK